MKAAQILKYSKTINAKINDIPFPDVNSDEVLIQVKAAAVNPLDIMNITGSVKLIQDYPMPLTLGNELSGIVKEVGKNVNRFKPGDHVYTRLPVTKIGAFAEYVAVEQNEISLMPKHLDFVTAAAVPLTGLTAFQGLKEILKVSEGDTVFIAGGSGGFGQMAVPIAKAMGLKVIVSGNLSAKDRLLESGVDQYFDYKNENYWEQMEKVDYVIDAIGVNNISNELDVIKPGGKLLSLIAGPNKDFAKSKNLNKLKQFIFGLVGKKIDKMASAKKVEYKFMFVESSGKQLDEITSIIEEIKYIPEIDDHHFTLEQVNEAIEYVRDGHPKGKVVIRFS